MKCTDPMHLSKVESLYPDYSEHNYPDRDLDCNLERESLTCVNARSG